MTHPTDKQRAEAIEEATEDLRAFESRIESLVITGSKQLRYARVLLAEVEAREKAEVERNAYSNGQMRLGVFLTKNEAELAATRAKIAELEARVVEEEENYIKMMELRDAEIRKVSQLEATVAGMREAIEKQCQYYRMEGIGADANGLTSRQAELWEILSVAQKASAPTDYERRVEGLERALARFDRKCWCPPSNALTEQPECEHVAARQALADFRGEK